MDEYDYLRFAALVHDIGKVWNRKHHERQTIDLLKSVNFLLPDEKMREIYRAIDKTHSFGNPIDDYWLLKIADRKACKFQRSNGDDDATYGTKNKCKLLKNEVPESLLPTIQRILHNQFREHFIINDFDLNNLRKFIYNNQWLDMIRADVNDHNESSLREHLLMTEQMLDLLIDYIKQNPTKNFYDLQKSEKLQQYTEEKIKEIPKPNGNKVDLVNLSGLVGEQNQNASDEATTHHMGRVIIIPVSMLSKYLFCNYQPYVQYVKYGRKMKINGESVKNGDNSHKQLMKEEKKVVSVASVMDGLKQSSASEEIFTFHEIFLKSEAIPGILLLGSIDKLDIWKGRMMLTERKFVRDRKKLEPYENEVMQIVAYALLIKNNFGIKFEDLHCSIELNDIKSKQLLKKISVQIDEKNIAAMKKILWELYMILLGAKIPEPTKNNNKCRMCRLNAKQLCDKADQSM